VKPSAATAVDCGSSADNCARDTLMHACAAAAAAAAGIPQRLGSGFLSRGRKASGIPMTPLATGTQQADVFEFPRMQHPHVQSVRQYAACAPPAQQPESEGNQFGLSTAVCSQLLTDISAMCVYYCCPHPPCADDPDQPARPRLRAGLSTLQRSSAAAAGTAAVGSSSSFSSTPAQGLGVAGTSPTQLPPAAARPGAAVQMTVQTSPLQGVQLCKVRSCVTWQRVSAQ
jgi:hypothetical protein